MAKIEARFHNFGIGLQLSASYQAVAPRIPILEAEIERLRQRQFELQMERNMATYGMGEWAWQQAPDPPTGEEMEILAQLIELSTQLCHDLAGLKKHAEIRLDGFGLDA
jgi:hypothetical protein